MTYEVKKLDDGMVSYKELPSKDIEIETIDYSKITKAEVSNFSDSKDLPRSIGRALLEKFGNNAESVFLNPTEEQYNEVMLRAWDIYEDPEYSGDDDSLFMVWPFESFKK